MDTDSLYLALSEENLEYIILPEKRIEWETILSRIVRTTSLRILKKLIQKRKVRV